MDAHDPEDLRRLIKLARDKSRDSRRELLGNVSDLFLSPKGRLSDRERSLMSDILVGLITDMEMTVRREIAERLAQDDSVSHDLAVFLANDEIEVARPILLRSGVLQDVDLIEIIKRRTQQHMLAIARRKTLSENVSDALVDNGGEDVIETLLKNRDAVLSRRALEYIVEESKQVDRFQRPLLARNDLPPELAHRIFWWVSAALRQHIMKNFQVDEEFVDDLIADTTRSVIDKDDAARNSSSAAERLAGRLDEAGELSETLLVRAMHQGKINIFTAGLARLCRVELQTAERIVHDTEGEALAVAWKALGFERSNLATVLSETRHPGHGGQTVLLLDKALELFDSVSEKNARRTLSFWNKDGDYLKAIMEIEDGED